MPPLPSPPISAPTLIAPFFASLVCENGRAFQANSAEQFFSDSDIMDIAGGQHDLNRIAQGVHNGVNLRTSASATDPEALIGLGFVFAILKVSAEGFYSISGF